MYILSKVDYKGGDEVVLFIVTLQMRKDWFIAEEVDRFCERLDSFGM